MNEAIAKVKAAIAPKDIASHLSHYLVKGGMIYASDNRITAAAPFPLAGDFLVPGGEFEKMAARFGAKTKVEMLENKQFPDQPYAVFNDGRMKATLQTLPLDTVDYQRTPGRPEKLPEGFLPALAKVRPFISDNAVHYWALAVCLGDDHIYATNNIVVAAAHCQGLKGGGRLLPCWAVDYLLSRQEALVGAIYEVGSMTFLWEDKSWMRSQLVDSEFPQGAIDLIAKLGTPTFKLSEEWKAAYSTLHEMSDNIIELHADHMAGLTERGVIEVAATTPAPPDGCSKWNSKFLTPVVEAAEMWSPDVWPKPSPFIGSGIKGLIVGRN